MNVETYMYLYKSLQCWMDSSTHLHMNGWSMKAQLPLLVSLTMLRLV